MIDYNLEIIYKDSKPYGIRNKDGFLFFFVVISKYQGQEERYKEQIEQQVRLADYLLSALKQHCSNVVGEGIG